MEKPGLNSQHEKYATVAQLVEAHALGACCCEFESHWWYRIFVRIAQLDRALRYERKGWRFESSCGHQTLPFVSEGILEAPK